MKRILFSVALALSLVTPIRSQTPDHTGAWWNSLSRPQRIAFVAGYLEASATVSSSVFLRCLAEKNNGVVPEKAPSDAEIDRCSARAKALPVPKFQNQTFGQISDGIDKFYSDYRNANLHVNFAIRFSSDELSNKPASEVEAEVIAWRKLVQAAQ